MDCSLFGTHLPLMPVVASNYSIAYFLLQVNTVVCFVVFCSLSITLLKLFNCVLPTTGSRTMQHVRC